MTGTTDSTQVTVPSSEIFNLKVKGSVSVIEVIEIEIVINGETKFRFADIMR